MNAQIRERHGVLSADQAGALTARERKIAGMLAEGMSNRDIATNLVVSCRTVESHVQHILTKLGFHSRTQVVALVNRIGAGDRPRA